MREDGVKYANLNKLHNKFKLIKHIVDYAGAIYAFKDKQGRGDTRDTTYIIFIYKQQISKIKLCLTRLTII